MFIRRRLGARPFSLLHHASAAHAGLQAADYALWAVHRKWQGGDARSHVLIAPFLRSERRTDLSGEDWRGRPRDPLGWRRPAERCPALAEAG